MLKRSLHWMTTGVLLLLVMLTFLFSPTHAADEGTAKSPPFTPSPVPTLTVTGELTKTVLDELWRMDGAILTYTVAFSRTDNPALVAAAFSITDTLGSHQAFVAKSIRASTGTANTNGTQLMWSGPVTGSLQITYAVTVSGAQVVTNTARLCCVDNEGVPEVLAVQTEARVRRVWLPLVEDKYSVAPLRLTQLVNPGFEDTQKVGWTQLVDGASGNLIYSTEQSPLEGTDGSRYAWLGGVRAQQNRLEQRVVLAAHHDNIKVRYRYWHYSEEPACVLSAEWLEVRAGNAIRFIPLCAANATYDESIGHGWVEGELALGPGSGQQVTLSFSSSLDDDDRNSNFFLDNVRLCSTDPNAASGDKCP